MIGWLKHDWRLKLVAFCLAVFMWGFVNSLTNERQVMEAVPLQVLTPPGLTLVRQSVERVAVEVRGTRDEVRQVTRQNLQVVLDLSRLNETGLLVRRLRPSMVRHPRWVQPVAVSPVEVTVMVDEMVERELPVVPEITGELPAGHVIERIVLRPDKIRWSGPKSLLHKLTEAKTLPIDVTGRHTSFRERVELAPVNLGKDFADRHWVEVDVRVQAGPPVDTSAGAGVEPKSNTR